MWGRHQHTLRIMQHYVHLCSNWRGETGVRVGKTSQDQLIINISKNSEDWGGGGVGSETPSVFTRNKQTSPFHWHIGRPLCVVALSINVQSLSPIPVAKKSEFYAWSFMKSALMFKAQEKKLCRRESRLKGIANISENIAGNRETE
jgi:hypothetical protein